MTSEFISWEERPIGRSINSSYGHTTLPDGGISIDAISYFDIALGGYDGAEARYNLGLHLEGQTSVNIGTYTAMFDFGGTLSISNITLADGTSLADAGLTFEFESQRAAQATAVPEPSSLSLFAVAAVALTGSGLRRRKASTVSR